MPGYPQPLRTVSKPTFRVGEAGSKGLGLFAARALGQGELIIDERPLLISVRGVPVAVDPLTPDEITAVCDAVRLYTATNTDVRTLKLMTCYLLPPPKKVNHGCFGAPCHTYSPWSETGAAGAHNAKGASRRVSAFDYRSPNTDGMKFQDVASGCVVLHHLDTRLILPRRHYNSILSLREGTWMVDLLDLLEDGLQPAIPPEEQLRCEVVVRADPRVQQFAKDVGVLPEEIFCESWAIGYDDRFPPTQRLQQGLMFARFSQHDNLYAHPMDFTIIYDSIAEKVIHIEFPPHYKDGLVSSNPDTSPPDLQLDPLVVSGRERVPPPRKAFDFLPDLMAAADKDFKQRDDLKPLHILQPEGVSFRLDGQQLEWQNWKMHIAFHHREGLALSTITYNDHGEVRPLFYRLSLSEMVVPYGAPEYPHGRKSAFDA
ncbi:Amine oxidase [Mycena indigotica]|uniref:Amine oxidase n=1 Tax=Mycena indigotica TaxID=2126181 RepID=A0A8H6S000_9AGAR|nr:Amine oxidase [Mycena indigotica]KAF7289377.1 Amine oxidase [Mycena indigotica]